MLSDIVAVVSSVLQVLLAEGYGWFALEFLAGVSAGTVKQLLGRFS